MYGDGSGPILCRADGDSQPGARARVSRCARQWPWTKRHCPHLLVPPSDLSTLSVCVFRPQRKFAVAQSPAGLSRAVSRPPVYVPVYLSVVDVAQPAECELTCRNALCGAPDKHSHSRSRDIEEPRDFRCSATCQAHLPRCLLLLCQTCLADKVVGLCVSQRVYIGDG